MKYMKDEEDAADVTQDALLLAYRHRASFRGNSRFTTWLYRIAATTALMHLRKRRRQPPLVSVEPEDLPVDEIAAAIGLRPAPPTPEEQHASSEALALARGELAQMGEKY